MAQAALAAIGALEGTTRKLYHDTLMTWLSEATRRELMMIGKSYFPQSDFAKEHYGRGMTEGLQEGEARILRRVLQLRFGALPDAIDARLAKADCETLLRWTDRVLTATTAEEVFAEP